MAAAVISIDKPYSYLVPPQMEDAVAHGRRVMVPFGRGSKLTEGFVLEVCPEEEPKRLKPLAHVFDETVALDEEMLALAAFLRKRYFCTFFEAADLLVPPGVWSQKTPLYEKASGWDWETAQKLCGDDWDLVAIAQMIFESSKPISESMMKKSFSAEAIRKGCKVLLEKGLIEQTYDFEPGIKDQTIRMLSLAMPPEEAISKLRRGSGYENRVEILKYIAQFDHIPEKEVCYITGAPASSVRTLVKNKLLNSREEETYRRPVFTAREQAESICLNEEQQAAYDSIGALAPPAVALLHGVTGSGKTQIYLELIHRFLAEGKSAMLLVPEIALTPQMVRQFCAHFQEKVAVLHSALSPAQRYDEYKRIRQGKATVVVGTRSAVFAPIKNLGIIILDEEQEWTYKSDITPRYHAREVAKFRCVQQKALLVLGSATPAVESFYHAEQGQYHLFSVTERYQNTPLPKVVLSDMRKHLKEGNPSVFGAELQQELEINLERGEQSILFLNRRGNSRMLTCVSCGYVPQCPNCSAALTYHSKNNRLMCHYCGHSEPLPTVCPQCGESNLKLVGCGTQKAQEELEERFPGVSVIRMDADTTVQRTSHEKLLDQFASGGGDILLGTQMIAKGLDFDNVTLVGVLDADLSLYNGDYRAGERTFSLLTQVVGRAGRREKTGRAVIQTYTPENEVIQAAAAQDYRRFYRYEIEMRKALDAPPFHDVISFLVSSEAQAKAERAAMRLAATIRQGFASAAYREIAAPVLGPVQPWLYMLNKRFRYQILFRGADDAKTREFIARILKAFYADNQNRAVTLIADINPYSL